MIPYITSSSQTDEIDVDLDCIVLDGNELVMASAIDVDGAVKKLFADLITPHNTTFNLLNKKDYYFAMSVTNSESYTYRLARHSDNLTHGIISIKEKDNYIFDWDGKGLVHTLTLFLREKFFLPITEELCERMLDTHKEEIKYALKECDVFTNNENVQLNVWKVDCSPKTIETWIGNTEVEMESSFDWDKINDISEYLVEFTEPIKKRLKTKINVLHKRDEVSKHMFDGVKQPYEGQISMIQGGIEVLNQKKNRFVYLTAEPGSGKTLMGTKINHAYHLEKGKGNYCTMVVAPATTLVQWGEEIRESIGDDVDIMIIEDTNQFIRFYNQTKLQVEKPTYILIGKETFKLSYKVEHGVNVRKGLSDSEKGMSLCTCPDCGSTLTNPLRTEKTFLAEEDFESPRKSNYKCNECNSVLFQAVYDKNRKTSVIDFIKRRNIKLESVIVDEAHEGNGDSIIGIASRDIMRRAKKVVLLSGTVTNGYASSIYNILFGLVPRSLESKGVFNKDDFVRKYGTMMAKTKVKDSEFHVTSRTKVNDSSYREVEGISPGVYTELMLENFITAELDDIKSGIPKPIEKYVGIKPLKEVRDNERQLLDDIMRVSPFNGSFYNDSVVKHYANNPFNWNRIPFEFKKDGIIERDYVYPKNVDNTLLPKEKKLIEILKAEKESGRKSWVYCDFVTNGKYTTGDEALQSRLARLLRESGLKVFVLSSNVKTIDRAKEIERVRDTYDIFISHPKLVSVGLNLQWCTNYVFYTPSYHVNTVRQASLRGRRINSTVQNRIFHLYYKDSLEEEIMERYKLKLAESEAIESRFSSIDVDRTASGLGAKIEKELASTFELASSH